LEKFKNIDAVSVAYPDFECNQDFTLVSLITDHPEFKDCRSVMIQTLTSMHDSATVLFCTEIHEDAGCGAIEFTAQAIKDKVAFAAITLENSIFSGTFNYDSSRYLRYRYENPSQIINSSVIGERAYYFKTRELANKFLCEVIMQSI
jgi:hypothetical protein